MARYQSQTKTRSLREDTVKAPDVMPPAHRVCLVALVDACIHAGVAVYVGSWARSGRLKLKFYTGDEVLESFMDSTDNPEEWLSATGKHFLSPGLLEEVLQRVGAGRVVRAGDASRKT